MSYESAMSNWPIPIGGRAESFGQVTADSAGTTITSGGSSNTKGSYVELIATTSFDYDFLVVALVNPLVSREFYLDIAIGASGSETIIIADLLMSVAGRAFKSFVYHLPIAVSAGLRVSARTQCQTSSATTDVAVIGYQGAFNQRAARGSLLALGLNSSVTLGTAIDPGGTANTKGSWVQLSASTGNNIDGVYISIGSNSNVALDNASFLLDIAVGASGSEQVIASNINISTDVTSDMPLPSNWGPLPLQVPSGTRIAARTQCSITDATDRVLDVAVYGLVQ